MEFLDEYESRPRIVLQSQKYSAPISDNSLGSPPIASLHRAAVFFCVASAFAILVLVFFYFHTEPLKSLLLWLSISLLLGPFAPPSLTAGDVRVGVGPPVRECVRDEISEKSSRKPVKIPKKPPQNPVSIDDSKSSKLGEPLENSTESEGYADGGQLTEEKSEVTEWDEADNELLKKLMAKHPVGKPGRWEDIARGFNGRFKVEMVIQKAKDAGIRNSNEEDSYKKFLKQRKPVDKRVVEASSGELETDHDVGEEGNGWSGTEDLALLNALKAFPKDAPLRWEKISASVPGKSKAVCIKRVAELKKNFRSSKGSSGQA